MVSTLLASVLVPRVRRSPLLANSRPCCSTALQHSTALNTHPSPCCCSWTRCPRPSGSSRTSLRSTTGPTGFASTRHVSTVGRVDKQGVAIGVWLQLFVGCTASTLLVYASAHRPLSRGAAACLPDTLSPLLSSGWHVVHKTIAHVHVTQLHESCPRSLHLTLALRLSSSHHPPPPHHRNHRITSTTT